MHVRCRAGRVLSRARSIGLPAARAPRFDRTALYLPKLFRSDVSERPKVQLSKRCVGVEPTVTAQSLHSIARQFYCASRQFSAAV